MFKYLAVIKDSFREAFASRILWLLLIGITLLLALLAPFGFREVVTTKFTENDFRDPWELLDRVRKEGQKEVPSPSRRIWSLLDEKYRTRLATAKLPSIDREQGNPFQALGVFQDFSGELNKVLEQADLVDEESWKDVAMLSTEGKALADKRREKKLAPNDTLRFNRLMVEAAYAGMVRESPPTSVQWRYAWRDVLSPDPLTGDSIRTFVQNYAASVLTWLVGFVGVIIAILVTSPIVPQMFDQGSLHLLLSKPVSRWMLLLSKYVGGCAFILLIAGYLIIGLWLILGLRIGIWESRLLLSIPIYLFVFSMYYSVSLLAGVIWRSPIVSVAIAILFWGGCKTVGLMDWALETCFVQKDRYVSVVEANDSLIATNEMGLNYKWDESLGDWQQVFTSNEQRGMWVVMRMAPAIPRELRGVGPVFDKERDQLVSAVPVFASRTQNLNVGSRKMNWDSVSKTSAPLGTSKILVEPTGKLLFIANLGLFRLVGDPVGERKPVKLFGMDLPIPSGGPMQEVNPEPAVLVTSPSDTAINRATGEVAIYTRATVTILTPSKKRYAKKIEQKLDGDERQAAVLAFGGDVVVVGRFDGRIQVLDAATLKQIEEFNPEHETAPRFMDASPDGRWFSVLFHNGRLWLYDAKKKSSMLASVGGQGDISAANFGEKGSLLVVDRGDRLSEYGLDPVTRNRRVGPGMSMWLWTYRYVIWPVYIVFPKPSELDRTFAYLMSDKKEKSSNRNVELAVTRESDDPWTPVWSSAAFTLVILLVACVYIEFQEF